MEYGSSAVAMQVSQENLFELGRRVVSAGVRSNIGVQNVQKNTIWWGQWAVTKDKSVL